MNFDKKLIEINPNQLFDDEDYFYCTSDKFTLLENIKIHKLCFLNQFMDFIKLIKIKTGQDLIFKPGISELNKFREQNEELVDFIIVLEYNLNFLELSSKNDKEVIKQLQSLINKIKDIRQNIINNSFDFVSALAKIDKASKNLERYSSLISNEYKIKGKFLYEILSDINSEMEQFRQNKKYIEDNFNLYSLDITGKILFPIVGILYKSK